MKPAKEEHERMMGGACLPSSCERGVIKLATILAALLIKISYKLGKLFGNTNRGTIERGEKLQGNVSITFPLLGQQVSNLDVRKDNELKSGGTFSILLRPLIFPKRKRPSFQIASKRVDSIFRPVYFKNKSKGWKEFIRSEEPERSRVSL